MEFTSGTVFASAFLGFVPALFWVWFWRKEDRLHPEPRSRIAWTFLGGILAAILSLGIERYILNYGLDQTTNFVLWAATEEILKFLAVYWIALTRKDTDEPIDNLIYVITCALGFAGIENTLFLLHPIVSGEVINTLITGNLRFIGASLLHVVCSSVVGLALAFTFYRPKPLKELYASIGLIIAILLHSLFNIFIIDGTTTFAAFSSVWVGVVLLIALFEKVKRIRPHN